jgi:nicotinate-nucleotide pyrophosphorylase (carboxylating)
MNVNIPWDKVDPLIEHTLREDLGEIGDITTDTIIPENLIGKGKLIAREEGIVAGLPVAERVFSKVDQNIVCLYEVEDGASVLLDSIIGIVEGPMSGILKAERTALNFLQRLSGIATQTHLFVEAVRGTGVKILDTRKTTPQLRLLEKYAVRQGGGKNHRFGLFDMVLIKDNHIDASGGITPAVNNCLTGLKNRKLKVKIEVECRTLKDVQEALRLPIDRIMLDNMDIESMKKAVSIINRKVETEASGMVNLQNVRAVAETGVDYISIGALTHSYRALDISLIVMRKS